VKSLSSLHEKLATQPVIKSFFQYFLPTLFGMMLMSVNIVIDGIFVGNGIGSVALASVNVAVPVFSIIISIALLIGVGGGTLYSIAMGEGKYNQARFIFTLATVFVTVSTCVVSGLSYFNMESIAYFFGANDETLSYVLDYMGILLLFSLIITWETALSIFVRNDGGPRLAMMALIVSALLNVGLNYWMIFILKMEVKGAALATVIATAIGLIVLMMQFFRKGSGLRFVRISWDKSLLKKISAIGFPSFLSEVGVGVFVIGYNLAMSYYVGTNGLAAFSVINYLHTFMFLAFIGIGSSVQPLISYYYGAKKHDMIKETIKVAELTAIILGFVFFIAGWLGADFFVRIFGVSSDEITRLATSGIKLFFIGYLFMGINFVYMTYFQAIGQARPSIIITLCRGFVILIAMLLVLPYYFDVYGIWLALPVTEAFVAIGLFVLVRPYIFSP